MIDFTDPQFVADPYPALKELRNAPGPVWHEGMQMFLAARHSDANDVFRNKSLGRIFKEKTPDFEQEIFNWLHADSILDTSLIKIVFPDPYFSKTKYHESFPLLT